MTTLIVLGFAFVVFVLTIGVLHGVKSTCAGRCDESDQPDCDFCPRQRDQNSLGGGVP